MTELLYMQDFDVETCEAKVVSISQTEDGRTDMVLDQTCMYARGGGQDWDYGTISKDEAIFTIDEVRLDEVGIVHHFGIVTSGTFAAGDQVRCVVDHERRMINTRLHSAGHVLDMAVDSLGLDWVGGKGQHYPDLSALEYTGTWDPEQAEKLRAQIEQQANELIVKGSENKLLFMPVEEMHTVCRYVPENIPRNKPGRVVMYGDFGIPCGGTHIRDIHDIGRVYATKLKEKKGIIRLTYAVEGINNTAPEN